jgi:putative Mg2+ transporter-C (MgtC) family protein
MILASLDAIDPWLKAWLAPAGWTGQAIFSLLLAAILGGLVGLEREIRGRQAGFRTNLLVSLGSALVMVVSIRFAHGGWAVDVAGAYNINVDPGRIAYSVMSGIGFIGAGTILKQDVSVRGLTTAAGMWCVAAIGLAAGFGLYTVAVIAAGMVVAALWLLDIIERRLPRRTYRRLTLRMPWHDGCVPELIDAFAKFGAEVVDHRWHRTADLSQVDVQMSITCHAGRRFAELEQRLHEHPGWELMSAEKI